MGIFHGFHPPVIKFVAGIYHRTNYGGFPMFDFKNGHQNIEFSQL